MPESIWSDLDSLANYLNESYDYVMSLAPKWSAPASELKPIKIDDCEAGQMEKYAIYLLLIK
jgi:hypothetical protein